MPRPGRRSGLFLGCAVLLALAALSILALVRPGDGTAVTEGGCAGRVYRDPVTGRPAPIGTTRLDAAGHLVCRPRG
ncbi:hypothetical protein [Methylobacterium sp. ID0610]|uniref:hypothetical protein n=1 Tax=Methylobacterium carpenticola TaxID=3344827 RepID=UPI0036908A71